MTAFVTVEILPVTETVNHFFPIFSHYTVIGKIMRIKGLLYIKGNNINKRLHRKMIFPTK